MAAAHASTGTAGLTAAHMREVGAQISSIT